jgi:hypothetical protein
MVRRSAPWDLPPDMAELVDETVRGAQLPRADQLRVARELAAHIQDAMSAGHSAAAIRASYGDARLAGSLIGRARAQRSFVFRSGRAAAWIGATLSVVYVSSLVRLHASTPASPPSPAYVDSVVAVARLEQTAALLAPTVQDAPTPAQAQRVLSTLELADRAVTYRSPFATLVAITMVGDAVTATEHLVSEHPAAFDRDARTALATRLRRWAPGADRELDLAAIRWWYDDLMQRSFSVDGRLTVTGLRLVQAMKGVQSPSRLARVLEPVLFASPADASAVRDLGDRLIGLGALELSHEPSEALSAAQLRVAFQAEADRLLRSRFASLRYISAAMVIARVTRGIQAQETVDRRLPALLAQLGVAR